MAFCSTGQKYVYTGSSDSSVYIYDLVCTLFLSIPPPLLYQYHVACDIPFRGNAVVEGSAKCHPSFLVLPIGHIFK